MANKHDSTCLQKAGDDEPIFVLRAQDKFAPLLVRLWAGWCRQHGCPEGKAAEAENVAAAMEKWPQRKYPD